MVPTPCNDLFQIYHTPGYVVLFPELSTNPVRIIPTDGRSHILPRIRQWSGDSVGHWESDTLVVEMTNFTSKIAFEGSSDTLHVVERFTRIDEGRIMYEFTVRDSKTWSVPWSTEISLISTEGPLQLQKCACHEGNYGIVNTLRGARRAYREARRSEASSRP